MKTAFELIEEHGLTLHGDIEHFAELVRADAIAEEREACAKVADGFIGCDPIAEKIRARGNT